MNTLYRTIQRKMPSISYAGNNFQMWKQQSPIVCCCLRFFVMSGLCKLCGTQYTEIVYRCQRHHCPAKKSIIIKGTIIVAIAVCLFALIGCQTIPTEKMVSDVTPPNAYFERYKHANTIELELMDMAVPCKHFKGVYYFPNELYAALMIKDKEALAYYYPNIKKGIVINPRVFVSDIDFNDAYSISEHCGIEVFVNETELRLG